jgi:hypothetical protein
MVVSGMSETSNFSFDGSLIEVFRPKPTFGRTPVRDRFEFKALIEAARRSWNGLPAVQEKA